MGTPWYGAATWRPILTSPRRSLAAAQKGEVSWNTHTWRGQRLRCVLYPLRLVGSSHGIHVLQVAAPLEPIQRIIRQFALLVAGPE